MKMMLALLMLALSAAAYAQTGIPALIAHTESAGGTSAPIDTTGANFLAVCTHVGATVTDSANNAWNAALQVGGGYGGAGCSWYTAFSITTSPRHTFKVANNYPFAVVAFSHAASGPDQTAKDVGLYPPSVLGPVTPSRPNEIFLSGYNGVYGAGSAPTIKMDPGWTIVGTGITNSAPFKSGITVGYMIGGAAISAVTNHITANEANGQGASLITIYSDAAPAPLTSTTPDALPEAVAGQPYKDWEGKTVCLTLQGGAAPIKWAHGAGSLPTGVTLNSSTGCFSGQPSGTASAAANTFTATDAQGHSISLTTHMTSVATALAFAHPSCSTATQLQSYSCDLAPRGGTGVYTCSDSQELQYTGMPEGMVFSGCKITSSRVNAQGGYTVGAILTDTGGGRVLAELSIPVNGDNTFGGQQLFPADSAYHLRVDSLPALPSTSLFRKIYGAYQGRPLRPLFGSEPGIGGMVLTTVPYNQASYPAVSDGHPGTTFIHNTNTVPVPCDAAIEGGRNAVINQPATDHHVTAVLLAGGGHPAADFELYQMAPNTYVNSSNCKWTAYAYSGAFGLAPGPPFSLDSYALPGHNVGTTDAAGLPILSELLNYDEVKGTCAAGKECGEVKHAIRFSLGHTINYYFWPGTSSAGLGANSCNPVGRPAVYSPDMLDQHAVYQCIGSKPGDGNMLNPMGEVFRLAASFAEPAACASNPTNHIIFTALKHYGIILADNGSDRPYLMGTADARWQPFETTNGCLSRIPLSNFEGVDTQAAAANWPHDSRTTQRAK